MNRLDIDEFGIVIQSIMNNEKIPMHERTNIVLKITSQWMERFQ